MMPSAAMPLVVGRRPGPIAVVDERHGRADTLGRELVALQIAATPMLIGRRRSRGALQIAAVPTLVGCRRLARIARDADRRDAAARSGAALIAGTLLLLPSRSERE